LKTEQAQPFMTEGEVQMARATVGEQRPMISVIMPTFNSERFLEASVLSVLQQDFRDFELLVVDDGSVDASVKIAMDFARSDHRVRCLINRHSKGVSGARNTGLDNARGEWIAFLDSDDLLTEKSFSSRLEYLAQTPSCRILAAEHSYIDEAGTVTVERRFASVGLIERARQGAGTHDRHFCLKTPIDFFLDEFCLMWTGSILLQRSVIERAGRFDETMTHGEDTRYWFQAALHETVYFFDSISVQYRQSAASASADMRKALKGREMFYRKLAADREFIVYRAKATRRLAMAINDGAYFYRENRRFWLAMVHALRAIGALPTHNQAWRNLLASVFRIN
jgi:glycosyltransferase involved in cell wall biosynthesis